MFAGRRDGEDIQSVGIPLPSIFNACHNKKVLVLTPVAGFDDAKKCTKREIIKVWKFTVGSTAL